MEDNGNVGLVRLHVDDVGMSVSSVGSGRVLELFEAGLVVGVIRAADVPVALGS